jgi:3-deoxy-D-manno-octulosonic-acid transferase
MYFVYSLITALGALAASPWLLFQGLRKHKYLSNLSERFGRVPDSIRALPGGGVWIHAVSVGEVLAALPLVRRMKQQFPDRPLIISTTTATGQKIARERFDFASGVIYFPFDWAWCVRRVLRRVKPACIVIMETEIWPNFLRESHRAGAAVTFANGRISEKSFRRHGRALAVFGSALKPFYKSALDNVALFMMQSKADAERIRELGAPAEKILVTGNLKYDTPNPPQTDLETWLADAVEKHGRRPLIVAGSVTANEEPLVLIAFGVLQGQMRNAFLILAPRKPERFEAAAKHIEESQREFVRRSEISLNGVAGGDAPALTPNISVLLLDSVGELAGLYRLADGVFVGGSLVPAGGHNLLEPAGFGKAPLFGPWMENFQELATTFLSHGAALQVGAPEDLGVAWIELIQDAERGRRMGDAARALIEENRGATDRTLAEISKILPPLSGVAGTLGARE